MPKTSPRAIAPRPSLLSPEDYFDLLHPAGRHGKPVLLIEGANGQRKARTLDREVARFALPSCFDTTSFLSLNRFRGIYRADQLAALNALFVDLDWHKRPLLQGHHPDHIVQMVQHRIAQGGICAPSFIIATGEGHALIWLIHEMPRAAETRWRAALRALIGYLSVFGADPACSDVTRVFRVPGSRNEGSGRTVSIIDGTRSRYDFDGLGDQIYAACGRPTRAQLDERKKDAAQGRRSAPGRKMPAGLPPIQRFKLIRQDLEKIRQSFGGIIPVGMRNNWLHIVASALAHDPTVEDLRAAVIAAARLGTPDLPRAEIEAMVRSAQGGGSSGNPSPGKGQGRYNYSGTAIADRLGISAETARALNLQQIIPVEERKRRKADHERQRRADNGAMSRAEWREHNQAARDEPWKGLGIGKTKYYRLKREEKLPPVSSN